MFAVIEVGVLRWPAKLFKTRIRKIQQCYIRLVSVLTKLFILDIYSREYREGFLCNLL